MYERFTDRARRVMQLANAAARDFNHEYIGVEHILLGLLRENGGVAANALKKGGIDTETLLHAVKATLVPGPRMVTMGKLPQTPRARSVIDQAIASAREGHFNYIGTEHLFIGVLRTYDAALDYHRILHNSGITEERFKGWTNEVLGSATFPDDSYPPDKGGTVVTTDLRVWDKMKFALTDPHGAVVALSSEWMMKSAADQPDALTVLREELEACKVAGDVRSGAALLKAIKRVEALSPPLPAMPPGFRCIYRYVQVSSDGATIKEHVTYQRIEPNEG